MAGVALLVIGGNVNPLDLSLASPFDHVCCADSGVDSARKLGLNPDSVVGDMDSISPESLKWIESLDIEIVRYSTDKEHTDSELAVTHLSLHHDNFERIHILGLSGNRPDHVYGNYLLLSRSFENTSLFAFVDGYMIQAVTEGKHWFTATPSSLVSVFPIRRPARVRMTGLKYNYSGLLNPLRAQGISNVAWGSFSIETSSELLLFIQLSH